MDQPPPIQTQSEFYQSLPKIDLHRHLEGSIRVRTLMEVARTHGFDIPNTGELRTMVQVTPEEPYTFQNFLTKFQNLRLFYRSPEIISRITRETIEDANADHIRYIELRFTPAALSKAQDYSLAEVVNWVIAGKKQAEEDLDTKVGLIASFNRHESIELATQIVQLAADHRADGFLGVDLAGNEAQFPALPFSGVLREAQQTGLHITVHAGEWGPASNVVEAIEKLNAERIGHGVRVMEDSKAMAIACEREIPFEVCLMSNYQSGVVHELSRHPLMHMLQAGLNATINTMILVYAGYTKP
jgi:adenosine deaminase